MLILLNFCCFILADTFKLKYLLLIVSTIFFILIVIINFCGFILADTFKLKFLLLIVIIWDLSKPGITSGVVTAVRFSIYPYSDILLLQDAVLSLTLVRCFCVLIMTILHRYVWEHLDFGYMQGMCDLAAPFLVIFDDEAMTYACFTRLMQRMSTNFPNGGAMDQHFANMR